MAQPPVSQPGDASSDPPSPIASDRLWEIFWQALEHVPEDREAFVDAACSGEARLHHQVRAMLRVHLSAPDFLETPAALAAEDLLSDTLVAGVEGLEGRPGRGPVTLRMPEFIGRFRIRRIIGYGGMGVVYEAEQERPSRTVALKVIRPEVTTPEHIRRFEYEAEILARLKHPAIAQVYEAGTENVEHGRQPFFAMELIEGRPINDEAIVARLDQRARLELMIRICEAVHHAHQQGVIHRDLKPGNILLTTEGQPKILDFGVARLATSEVDLMSRATEHGQLLGTLPYMSPEQVGGDPNEVDTRSDVYALGVVMYELLTGRLPYQIMDRMLFEAMRVIREEPPRPLSSINRTYRGDIETIAGKALQKDKRYRYQSAAELAADIRRHLNNELIEARPATTIEQAVKFARRNRALVNGVAASFILILLGLVSTLWMARIADAERDDATYQASVADERRMEADRLRAEAVFQTYAAALAAASAELELNRPLLARKRLDRVPDYLRNWEWHYLMARTDDSVSRAVTVAGSDLRQVSLIPESNRFAVAGLGPDAGFVEVRDRTSQNVVHQTAARRSKDVSIGVDLAGRYLAIPQDNGRLEVRRIDDWSVAFSRTFDATTVRAAFFTNDGTRLVAVIEPEVQAVAGANVIAFDTATWDEDPQWNLRVPWTFAVATDPQARFVLSGADTDITLLELGTGTSTTISKAHRLRIHAFRFNARADRLLTCAFDGTARLWAFPDMELVHEFGPFPQYVLDGRFLSDERHIALAIADGGIRVADLESGETVRTLHGHGAQVNSLVQANDTGRLWTASSDGTVRLWDLSFDAGPAVIRTGLPYQYYTTFLPGRNQVAVVGGDPSIYLFNAVDLHPVGVLTGHEYEVGGLDVNVASGRLVSGSNDGTLRQWELDSGQDIDVPVQSDTHLIGTLDVDPQGTRVACAMIGSRRFVVAHLDEIGRLGDVASAQRVLEDEPGSALSVRFSDSGTLVATGGDDAIVRLWDPVTAELRRVLEGAEGPVLDLAFVNDDRELLAVTQRGRLVRWDLSVADRHSPTMTVDAHGAAANAIALHPAGDRFATSAADGTIKIWDTERMIELLSLRDHRAMVFDVDFDESGERLVSSSFDGTLRIWHSRPVAERFAEARGLRAARRIVSTTFGDRTPDREASDVEAMDDLVEQVTAAAAAAAAAPMSNEAMSSTAVRMAVQEFMQSAAMRRRAEVVEKARPLADQFRMDWVTPEAARDQLLAAASIDDEDVRQEAARQAYLRGSHPLLLYQSCLHVLSRPGRSAAQYEIVRAVGEQYRKSAGPEAVLAFLSIEAAAMHRLGRFDASIAQYEFLEQQQTESGVSGDLRAADLAFNAMNLARQGAADAAAAALFRARDLVDQAVDLQVQAFARAIIEEAGVLVSGASGTGGADVPAGESGDGSGLSSDDGSSP